MSLQDDFLLKAYEAALQAPHIWPSFAACETALESNWGRSRLCRDANNLFGQKSNRDTPIGKTYVIRTWEDDNKDGKPEEGEYTVAAFVKFDSWVEAFRSRMDTLRRLADVTNDRGALVYPHYAAALAASDGPTFAKEVSISWATDPYRADKVLAIYRMHCTIFPAETH